MPERRLESQAEGTCEQEAGGPVLLWELGLGMNWPGETHRFLGAWEGGRSQKKESSRGRSDSGLVGRGKEPLCMARGRGHRREWSTRKQDLLLLSWKVLPWPQEGQS